MRCERRPTRPTPCCASMSCARDGWGGAFGQFDGGRYVSPQGTYNTYTQGSQPVAVLSSRQDWLGVRVYVDEILVHRLKLGRSMQARMFVRGTDTSVALEFVRVQPYLTPKIQLSDQRRNVSTCAYCR